MAKAMQPQKMRFSQAIQTPMYKNLVNNTLGDPARGARFIANITSAVAVNPALQECNPGTILAGALLGESLLLQPSPQLGQFYLVPFKSKAKRDRQGNVIEPASVKAQFMLGYKGYIQLALRTGQYKRLNVLEVKAGELSGWDPFEERFHEMHFIEDFEKRAAMPTVGYIAHFEYINGFEKTLYWTSDQMMAHADKYSQAFSAAAYKKLLNGEIPQDELWKYSSFWYIVSKQLDVSITMLDSILGGKTTSDTNFCGGTGAMMSFSPDGSAYPCIRYAPISIGEEKSKKVRFGSVYDGLYTTDAQRRAKAELDAITLTSQSEQKCIDCPVSAGCGWCSGLNYEMYGTANKRFTGICWAHKARVLASSYYHNRRYIEIGDCLPIKAELPKDDALEILPAADYEEFLKIERAALLKFADENGIS